MADVKVIRERAEELCREYMPASGADLQASNEFIIMILQKEFNLSREEAETHFLHNKER